jgi:hypothetical protein
MYGNIDKAIMEGIKNCDLVIICLTDKYINKINNAVYNNIPSDNCYKEWSYSLFLKKQIIPIVMEPYVKNNFLKEHGVVQMYLSNILYIDFSKSFDGKNFSELTPTLSSSIKRTLSFSSCSPARVAPILRSPSKIKQIRHLVNL